MADRIGVLNEGRIVQVGTPEDIYDRPATTFVAQLVGTPASTCSRAAARRRHADPKVSDVPLPAASCASTAALPDSFILGTRPEDVRPTLRAFHGEIA